MRSKPEIGRPGRKARPILFSGGMVRALLDGTKSQTRRVVKGDLDAVVDGVPYRLGEPIRCPYGEPGDLLWVRETFSVTNGDYPDWRRPSWMVPEESRVWYRADNDRPTWAEIAWRPSIFMPRWASRVTLRVTDVRVELLNSISGEDARAEGVSTALNGKGVLTSEEAFGLIWRELHGVQAWATNPYVWRVAFERVLLGSEQRGVLRDGKNSRGGKR